MKCDLVRPYWTTRGTGAYMYEKPYRVPDRIGKDGEAENVGARRRYVENAVQAA